MQKTPLNSKQRAENALKMEQLTQQICEYRAFGIITQVIYLNLCRLWIEEDRLLNSDNIVTELMQRNSYLTEEDIQNALQELQEHQLVTLDQNTFQPNFLYDFEQENLYYD